MGHDAVAAVLADVAALSAAEQRHLFRRLRDLGMRERGQRGERKAERNDRIRALCARGLTPGQIGRLEGMTRYAVRKVLRRGNSAGYVREVYPLKTTAVS